MAAAVRGSSVVGGSGVTSLDSGSFTSATGDTIGVWFNFGVSTDPTSVTDNKGNTYTQRGKVSRAGGFTAFLYTCENATGGAGTIVTLNIGFTEYPTLAAVAISGVQTSSVLDVLTTNGVDTVQPWELSSGTLSQADEIVFGFLGSDSGSSTSTFTEGSGMTKLGEVTDSNLYWTGALAYVVVNATTARVQSWSSSVAGSNSTQIVASFRAAAGGGGVSGTAAWTEADDAAALTGEAVVDGAAIWTEAGDTAALSGVAEVSGASAWTEADDTTAIAATASVSGSLEWTEEDDASDITGVVGSLSVSGEIAWTEQDDTATLTGTSSAAVQVEVSYSVPSKRKKVFKYDYSSSKEPAAVEPAKPVKPANKAKKSVPADVAEMLQLLESSQDVTAQVLAEQKAMRAAEVQMMADEQEMLAVIACCL